MCRVGSIERGTQAAEENVAATTVRPKKRGGYIYCQGRQGGHSEGHLNSFSKLLYSYMSKKYPKRKQEKTLKRGKTNIYSPLGFLPQPI